MSEDRRCNSVVNDAASLLAALPDVALVLDAMGRIDFSSSGSARYLGARPRDWIGLSILDRVHPEDVCAVVERLDLARQGLMTPTQALPLRVSVGDDRWRRVAAHGFVQVNAEGLTGTLVMFRDLTGSLTQESVRRAALDSVFNREERDVERDDRSWVATQLLPQVLDDPDPSGPLVAVIVMTLAGIQGSDHLTGTTSHENPVGALAHRVREILRPPDVLARLGDSQLVILCSGLETCRDGFELARRLHVWCSPSPLADAKSALQLTTGCAIASQGDIASDVLDFAASPQGQIESGGFALFAA